MPWINVNGNPPIPPTLEDLGYVQVVRCKDCKNFRPKNYVAPCKKVMRSEDANENWFCADGEKKVK